MLNPADRINALIRAAQLYHIHQLNQTQVAEVMRVHRTEVSRMLNEARRLGIVQVTVDATFGAVTDASHLLQERFGLETALIVPDPAELSYVQRLTKAGKFADSFLHSIIRSNSHVGVSWGLSLAAAADCFQQVPFPKNVTVLPLIGGPRGMVSAPYQANGVVYRLASRITGGVPYSLDTPAIVRSEALRAELVGNPNVARVVDMWSSLSVAIFGIGSSKVTGTRSWREFYKGTTLAEGLSAGAVGDILAHPFDQQGQPVEIPDFHVIGIDMERLRQVPRRVAIALGKPKAAAILGALRTGLITDLVTSQSTVEAIVSLIDSEHHDTPRQS
ncbi:MAG: sugar-binding domain-containing protein [Micropruina sp.]|uniref:sugar-binding transcriptional regulator n=1 Tax=Micropruina sp. TaxID=2737536 RepID=UPI0039E65481